MITWFKNRIVFALLIASLLKAERPTLTREPSGDVLENEKENIKLRCNSGNKDSSVTWYKDGQTLREIPDPFCEPYGEYDKFFEYEYNQTDDEIFYSDVGETPVDLCGAEPRELILQEVSRDFSGNYSCSVDGDISEDLELVIFYVPGAATVVDRSNDYQTETQVKCEVKELGQPAADRYLWRRGSDSFETKESSITVKTGETVGCRALSRIGNGFEGILELERSCSVSMSHFIEKEEVILSCSIRTDDQDVQIWWTKEGSEAKFEGQQQGSNPTSQVRVKKLKESAGIFTCGWGHAAEESSEDNKCSFHLTEALMFDETSNEVMIIVIIVTCLVCFLLLFITIIIIIYWWQDKDNTKSEEEESPKSSVNSLPFARLLSSEEIMDIPGGEVLEYIDYDHRQTLANGPIKYRETSVENARQRREKIQKRISSKSDTL